MSMETARFYLFASPAGTPTESPETVFYEVGVESTAKSLCALFSKEYSDKSGGPLFHYKAAISIPPEEQILLDEALRDVDVYDEPDRFVYDPPPPKELHLRAQYAVRARGWEELVAKRTECDGQAAPSENPGKPPENSPITNKMPEIPAEDWQNAGLIYLMLLAQTYYKLLETALSVPCAALDLDLNASYLWTVNNIRALLDNHEGLKDFPSRFEPVFPNLYPSTTRDVDWEDMVAPDAEQFLGTVQQYVLSKGVHDPEKGSPAWVFIELARPSVNKALESAAAYEKKMNQHFQRILESSRKTPISVGARIQEGGGVVAGESGQRSARPGADSNENHGRSDKGSAARVGTVAEKGSIMTNPTQRTDVFISYSHKDERWREDLEKHLKPYVRSGSITAWSDKHIQPGSKSLAEIQRALSCAKAAVLLVTPDFIASDFIHEHELTPLLKAAEDDGVRILWIPVYASSYMETRLKDYQALCDSAKPLAEMKAERQKAWVKICQEIKKAAGAS
jgi:hypothetical protein